MLEDLSPRLVYYSHYIPSINKQNLIDKNFDFNYITSFYKTKKGEYYKKVYDFAYKINNDIVVIVRCWLMKK